MIADCCALWSALWLALASPSDPVLRLVDDDTVVRSSCTVRVAANPIEDVDGDGVLQIVGDNLTVTLEGTLHGAGPDVEADAFSGIGVRVLGKNVTLRGARVSGFKAGIWASGTDGLVIEDCDVSGNFRQRLRSTPAAEDQSDWLWPHDNEERQWLHNYGAGIYVEDASGVTLRRNRAREGQNGACIVRVRGSEVYDNDFSFLSGWGLAMYRCEDNVVAHNSLDFCVRGYSHGVYSRGQDSAGILFFEQNSRNVIAYNSATHGGDGFFGFAGKEALEGEVREARIANNANLIYGNDFSYPPAIGIEMTFSFDNVFAANKLVGGNYGVWGGYSSDTLVIENEIAENVLAGIAVEHGSGWTVRSNEFAGNRRGVELWWDTDEQLLSTPWAQVNTTHSGGHRIVDNRFVADQVGVELRGGTRDVVLSGNRFEDVGQELVQGADDEVIREPSTTASGASFWDARLDHLPGERQAVGLRPELAGRERIVITEWGPYDGSAPYLQAIGQRDGAEGYRLLGESGLDAVSLHFGERIAEARVEGREVWVEAPGSGAALPYALEVEAGGEHFRRTGVVIDVEWQVTCFAWTIDPREDVVGWWGEAAQGVAFATRSLELPYGSSGPSQLAQAPEELRDAALPTDRFGTLARTRLALPPGTWRLTTRSDDGVRVTVDGESVIENWTWHAPTVDEGTFEVATEGTVEIQVEHFELDGYSTLGLELEPLSGEQ